MTHLTEIEAIKNLKYTYLRCLDTKSWDALSDCFAEDAVTSYSDGQFRFKGKDKIIAFLKEVLPPAIITMHQCFHPEVELTGDGTAKGTWALHDYLIELNSNISLRGYAFYHDEYVKSDGAWKIKSTGYSRVFEETWNRTDISSLTLTKNMFAVSDKI